jgi:hypothetical protein
MNKLKYLNSQYLLPFVLWIFLSFRFYPSDILKTLLHSGKIFIGCGFYGLGMTIIINGLLTKFAKKTLTRDSFIKIALWLAVITALAASLEFYFGLRK